MSTTEEEAPNYSSNPLWADIIPLPTNEGGPHPLAAIAYSDEYGETMSYLRAVMAIPEYSPRVLDLTEHIISMNPAHYTVWLYRARTLFELGSDLNGELEWLNEMAMSYQKNYQIWHHRNLIVDKLGDTKGDEETRAELIKGEQAFVERMFEADAKNYHVWSYRQWLVKRFALWEGWGELEFTERMVGKDVRNNSAWNHRWYMINGSPAATAGGGVKGDARIREREVTFAKEAIRKAPQNHSPWNYLRGIMRASGGGDGMRLAELREFLQEFAALDGEVTSSHALDLLADVYADEEDESGKIRAAQALDLLANKYDPIRKNYWEYRKGLLGLPTVGIVA